MFFSHNLRVQDISKHMSCVLKLCLDPKEDISWERASAVVLVGRLPTVALFAGSFFRVC